MIRKYQGLMQLMRGRLESKIKYIMSTDATVKDYKDFLKYVAKELISQERLRILNMKDNLYDKVLYYTEKRAATNKEKKRSCRKAYYVDVMQPKYKTDDEVGNKIDLYFKTKKEK